MKYNFDLKAIGAQSQIAFGHMMTREGESACLQVDSLLAIAERLEALVEAQKPSVEVSSGATYLCVNCSDGSVSGTIQEISKLLADKDKRKAEEMAKLRGDA